METKNNDLEHYHSVFQDNILLYYRGVFDNFILAGIGSYIKEVFRMQPQVSFKIFSIFIELAQNICYHTENHFSEVHQKPVKLGSLSIEEYKDHFKISAGNIIRNADIDTINKHCKKINALDNTELRELKKEFRKRKRHESGHASIGLIQVAISSANPISITTSDLDETRSFITLSTNITKQEQHSAI